MYKRISAFLFPVFGVLLAGALVWGYQANAAKEEVLIQSENNYQRAFHDLSFHMDKLHAELGNALAVNSTSHAYHRKCLVNVWRLSSEAINEIGQLPLSVVPLQETEQFLAKLSRFSYQTAVRDMDREPLSPEEMDTLRSLHARSKEISTQLQSLQNDVIAGGLRWTEVDGPDSAQNPIVDGFKNVNHSITEYDEVNWGPSMASLFEKRSLDKLDGKPESPEQIRQKAVRFFDLPASANVGIEENGEGTEYHTYSVTIQKEDGTLMEMDYTKKGGRLIWFMNERAVGTRNISAEQAVQSAQQFLQKHEFESMKPVNYDEDGNIAHVTMARTENGIVYFPDKLSVKVALDNGETIGLQATDYIFSSDNRGKDSAAPQLTVEEAKSMLNPEFAVEGHNLAVIENDLKQPVLCYQFSGQINGSSYRIFLNADNGMEEKVELVRQQSQSQQK